MNIYLKWWIILNLTLIFNSSFFCYYIRTENYKRFCQISDLDFNVNTWFKALGDKKNELSVMCRNSISTKKMYFSEYSTDIF